MFHKITISDTLFQYKSIYRATQAFDQVFVLYYGFYGSSFVPHDVIFV